MGPVTVEHAVLQRLRGLLAGGQRFSVRKCRTHCHLQLPPLKRIAAVQARLEALNLGKPVRVKHNLEGEQPVDVEIYLTGHEADLTPLMALTDLKRLVLNNCLPWQDASCVKFLPLEELTISEDAAYKNHRTLRAINRSAPSTVYLQSSSGGNWGWITTSLAVPWEVLLRFLDSQTKKARP